MHPKTANSLHPDTIIACYGKPRRTRRRQGGTPCRSPLPAGGEETLSPAEGAGSGEPGIAPGLGGTHGGSASTNSITLLGPRYWVPKGEGPGELPCLTLPTTSAAPRGLSGGGSLSLGQLKQLTRTRPPGLLEIASAAIGDNGAPDEPHCRACLGGFCQSSAWPHGPDGHCDHGRRRLGPRPRSQPASPAGAGARLASTPDGGTRPATASEQGVSSKGRRRKNTSASLEKWSNDGNSSLGLGSGYIEDYDEYYNGEHPMSPLGATWAAKPKHEKKSKNPFVEFEDQEQRRISERQWLLEEDGLYMQEKKKDLKHNRVQNHINLDCEESEALYEGNIFFGPYSLHMRRRQEHRKKKNETAESGGSASGTRGNLKAGELGVERHPNTTRHPSTSPPPSTTNEKKKGESAEALANPPSATQIKTLHRELEFSAKTAERTFAENSEQKSNKNNRGRRRHSFDQKGSKSKFSQSAGLPRMARGLTQDKLSTQDKFATTSPF